MHINISDIPEEGLTLDYNEEPLTLSEGTRVEGKIGVSLRVLKAETIVTVSGDVNVTLGLECSRCIKEFSYPLSSSFRVDYMPLKEMGKDKEYELKGADLDISFYKEDRIDLTELIKEQILISLPMQPLCSPDCKGLCPKCGKDLKVGPCKCEIKEIDPRFEILKKLKG